MVELELTFLVKSLPQDFRSLENKEVYDIYIPSTVVHPVLRIRKNGNSYEITKKQPIDDGDRSEQTEQTIPLTEAEFVELSQLPGKRVRKIRYYLPWQGQMAELDVFQDDLQGLVLIDFEFKTPEEKQSFVMPDFCLADVTQDNLVAGGTLAGKRYADIKEGLEAYHYSPL